jgi:transcriptional regulator GlxA family with amidase domain
MVEQKKVGIVIFDDVEVLDFCGPFEVFSVTRLDESTRRETESPFRVLLVSEKAEVVRTFGGMRVTPDCTFDDCPPLDIVLVPGGWGTRREMSNVRMLEWVRARAAQAQLTTSVCTGALVLGKAGLLDGRRATTHWGALDTLRESCPNTNVDDTQHVVEDGTVLTSAGISAGVDLALKVVAKYCGEGVARRTAVFMEYPYPESNQRRVKVA